VVANTWLKRLIWYVFKLLIIQPKIGQFACRCWSSWNGCFTRSFWSDWAVLSLEKEVSLR
jgi:hypothetical protein